MPYCCSSSFLGKKLIIHLKKYPYYNRSEHGFIAKAWKIPLTKRVPSTLPLYFRARKLLMLEMTHTGAEHRDAALIGLLHGVFIAYASAWLHDSLHTVFRCESHGVVEREESV